jgi:hypothetical protein
MALGSAVQRLEEVKMFNLDSIVDLASNIGSGLTGAIESVTSIVEPLASTVESGIGAYSAVSSLINPPSAPRAPARTAPRAAQISTYPAPQSPGGGYYSPSTGTLSPVQTYGSPSQPLSVIPASAGGGMPLPVTQAVGLPYVDIVPEAQAQGYNSLTSAFAPTIAGYRAKLHVLPNPRTGRPVWFRPVGQPILFSGDVATVKRVKRIAARARRVTGGRR